MIYWRAHAIGSPRFFFCFCNQHINATAFSAIFHHFSTDWFYSSVCLPCLTKYIHRQRNEDSRGDRASAHIPFRVIFIFNYDKFSAIQFIDKPCDQMNMSYNRLIIINIVNWLHQTKVLQIDLKHTILFCLDFTISFDSLEL